MENWERIEDIFNHALSLNPNARLDYVASQCEGDKHLQHQVLTLLDADDDSDRYLSDISDSFYPLMNDIELDRVKHYQLLEKIGEGGMGIVYKALDEKLQRIVAIKFLLAYRAKNPSDKTRFMHEAKAAAGLNHPNVCEVFDVDETEDGRLYIVTAFCEGKNLSTLIKEKKLSIGQLFSIVIQLCDALKIAHNNGIVHRDLKPENIIVGDDNTIQLVDFGIAKTAGSDISQTGQLVGTFAYMSPEQFSAGIIDQRTDIWALGILLFEALTGSKPFSGENAAEIMFQIFNNDSPTIYNHRNEHKDVFLRINHILQRCLSIEKQRRYHTTETIKSELQQLLDYLKPLELATLLCTEFFPASKNLTSSSNTAETKTAHTVNEYRKVLTLGITLLSTTTDKVKEIVKACGGVFDMERERERERKRSDNNNQLLICYFGFPLAVEKYGNNIIRCVHQLSELTEVDRLLIHNLPVTVTDNQQTGQRQLLGNARENFIHFLQQESKQEVKVLISESAAIRLRKKLPLSSLTDVNRVTDTDKKTLNHSKESYPLYHLSKDDIHRYLSVSREQYTTQLMGRYHELGLLESAWDDVNDGDARAFLITGEAGIGKTRLVYELIQSIKTNHHTKIKPLIIDCTFEPLQQDTAFYPITKAISKNIILFGKVINDDIVSEWLKDIGSNGNNPSIPTFTFSEEDEHTLLWLLRKANCLTETATPDSATQKNSSATKKDASTFTSLYATPESLKKKSFLLLSKILTRLCEKQSVVLIFEDLHWGDFSSLEWIDFLLSQPLSEHLLLAITGRPELFHRWRTYGNITQLSLNKLSRSDTRDLIHSLQTQSLLEEETENNIIAKTEGNPLFIEEYVHMINRQEAGNQRERVPVIPDSLDDILLSRLDLLDHSKYVAQAAAVIGRMFDVDLLNNILMRQTDDFSNNLATHLTRLNEADVIFSSQHNRDTSTHYATHYSTHYKFKHALIRDALYHTLPHDQRQALHLATAEQLISAFGRGDAISEEQIAQHLSAASDFHRAINWWLVAAKTAWSRHALLEVIRLCEHGIEDLSTLQKNIHSDSKGPSSNKHSSNKQSFNSEIDNTVKRNELDLHMLLGRAATATEGYASNKAANAHQTALSLATTEDDLLHVFPSLIGNWAYQCVSAQHREAEKTAQQLVDIAETHHCDDLFVEAYMLRGTTALFRGNFPQSFSDLSLAKIKFTDDMQQRHIDLYGQDPGVIIFSFLAILKEIMQDSDSALSLSEKAIASARRAQHPFSLAFALGFAVHIFLRLRQHKTALALLEENKRLCEEHGIHVFRLLGVIQEGLLNIATGKISNGIALIENNLSNYQSMGANLFMGTWHGSLALAHLKMGNPQAAVAHTQQGVQAVNLSGERISQGVLAIAGQHLQLSLNFSEPLIIQP